jgi:hypothetical protein
MTGIDAPTRVLARTFYVIWVAAVVLLVGAALIYSFGSLLGFSSDARARAPEFLVQAYLVVVPLGILVFSIAMIVRKQWTLGLTGLVLTLIWIGAKLLG